jgi:ribonuclease HII
MNILQATFLAMRRALAALCGGKIPLASRGLLLVDGNQYIADVPREIQKLITGGDAKSASIAAASILAKVTRDRIMEDYHKEYPQYGFAKHKGYGTKYHREMIAKYGLSPIHRRTFCGNVIQTTLFERC